MSDTKEKITFEWQPKWPSVKNLGGALKELVDGEYSTWRWNQPDGFNEPVHLVAHVQEWPYSFVVDFMQRIPVFLKLTGFASIDVRGPAAPIDRTDEQWHAETMRVLRSLNGPEVWITSDGGAILSKQCIISLVEELHKRAFASTPTEMDEERAMAVLLNNVGVKREGCEPYHGEDKPAVVDGRVKLDGHFNALELMAIAHFIKAT